MHDDNFEWLQIHVDLGSHETDDFVLNVIFENCSRQRQSVLWTFRNVLGKAESQSLNLTPKDGERLNPVEYKSGTAIAREHHEFKFGATQTHVIRGKVCLGHILRLGGASYLVNPDEEYEVCFQYGHVRSNVVLWRAPSAPNNSLKSDVAEPRALG